MRKVPPMKPYKKGAINLEFGGPATSPKDVLERARVTLSPRGAWSSVGWTTTNKEGHGRCIMQCFRDVDGIHVIEAKKIMLAAIHDTTGKKWKSVESFNDAKSTHKHHVIAALDRAIEMAT